VQDSPHILVIRFSAMGDVAMTVPIIRAFIQQHPTCKITLVSKPFLEPLFEHIPNVSFIAAQVNGRHKGILGLFRLFKEIKAQNITHVADLHNVIRSKILRSYFKLIGIPVKGIDKGRSEKKALTRTENKVFKQLKTSHQRYADVFKSLGFEININKPVSIKKRALSEKTKQLIGEKEHHWIGIAPFAAFKGKVYPLHLLEKVITELSLKDCKLLLFGGGEKEVQLLKDLEKNYERTLCIAGQFSFQEELELIQSLDVMISMDSGNAHLAAMQGVKTVTIWGVTHPFAGFAPYNQPTDYCILPDLEKYPKIPCSVYGNKIIDGYESVMESILPEKIVEKIQTVLDA